jgi:hypothetical protein
VVQFAHALSVLGLDEDMLLAFQQPIDIRATSTSGIDANKRSEPLLWTQFQRLFSLFHRFLQATMQLNRARIQLVQDNLGFLWSR